MRKPRARELGLKFPGKPGVHNAITDVAGVTVGFTTLTDPASNTRTGVTAIVPRQDAGNPMPVWAGQYSLNGNGEMTGTHWVNDAGYFFGPICITNTHSVGMVHHASTRWMIDRYQQQYAQDHVWAMPIVAETYDGVLNDINAQHIREEHVLAALDSANGGSVEEGSVGGGNGMICYEFKGGTGTSSRLVDIGQERFTVAALVQANHGVRPWLSVLGVPVGQHMDQHRLRKNELGSIIVILATDAPLSGLSLRQVAKRAAIGIGRGGTPGGNSSGDIFLAFSTANEMNQQQQQNDMHEYRQLNNAALDDFYLAAVESIEEAVINALVAGVDTPTFKPAGSICKAIDCDELLQLMQQYGR